MSVSKKIVYSCDICKKELPEEYKNTDGEGGSYFIWDTYNEVHLKEPILNCSTARVKVTLGGKDDDSRYPDICNSCKVSILRQAIDYYEKGAPGDEREETDVQPT